MNNIKRIISVVLCLSFILCMTVFAEDDFSGVNNDTEITVKGIASEKNAFVSLTVLNPGFSKEDAEAEFEGAELPVTELSAVMWIGHTLTGENGEFSFEIKFPEEARAEDYKLYAICGEETFEGVLRYVSNANKIEAVNGFSTASTKEELAKAVTDYSFTLSIFAEDEETAGLYEKYSADERFFRIFKSFGEYSPEIEKLNDSAAAINKNLEISLKLIETEEIESVEELSCFVGNNEELFGLDLSEINEDNYDYVYGNILALADIDEISDIQQTVNDSVILFGIRNAKNWGALKEIYEEYHESLEITVDSASVDYTSVYRVLYKERNDVDSVEKAVSEFNRLVKLYPKKVPSVGGGGGGGGGGGSVKIPDSGVVSKPITETPEKEEVKEENKVTMKFSDVPESFWAYEPIKALYEKGIIKGRTEEYFGSANNITREETAVLFVRAFGLELKENALLFKDVSAEAWYAAEVMIASSNKVLNGYPDGTFGTGKNITRQDLAVMLYNTVNAEEIKLSGSKTAEFKDSEDISSYALAAVNDMAAKGIINGYEDGSFRPLENATRAEVSALLYKLLEQVTK